MAKSDYPALRMIVDGGRLVPAGPFDAERINSYRNGAVVMCRMTEERDRVLVKKWFAVIGTVMKQCKTPWKTRDEAHEAIKLALGIVNLSKTVTGQWMQYPRSLSDLDDPEMREALDQMMALLSSVTGVDVEDLRAETATIAEDDYSGDATDTKGVEVAETAKTAAHVGYEAVTNGHSEAGSGVDGVPGVDVPDASESVCAAPIGGDDAEAAPDTGGDLLARYATEILNKAASNASGKYIAEIKKRWLAEFEGFPDDFMQNVEHITAEARRLFNGNVKLSEALENVAGLIGCDVERLRG